MENQYSNEVVKKRIISMGKLSSVVGYIFIISSLIMFFLGDIKENSNAVPSVLVLAAISIALILWGISYKKYIKIYKKYMEIIKSTNSPVISIEKISKATSEPEEVVLKNLNRMIKEMLLININIHDDNKTIVLKNFK